MSNAYERLAAKRGTEVPAPRDRNLHVVPAEPLTVVADTYRPVRLTAITGQPELTERLGTHLRSATRRGRTPGHILLDGPSGYGKTTFAKAIVGELGAMGVTSTLHQVMPNALPDLRALAIELSSLAPNDVLFLDEVHSIRKVVQEGLYNAMEDGVVIVPGEHGAMTVQLPPFTLVAATTEPGKVLAPLRNRFAFAGHIEGYTAGDLADLLLQHCEEAGIKLDVDAALVIAAASRNTPRLAINNLHRVRTYSDEVTEDLNATLDVETAHQGLEYNGLDKYGLDDRDRRVLLTLADNFRGGPIGLNPFSSTLGVAPAELTADIEPYLIQAGLLTLRGRGRCATRGTYLVLGQTVPPMLNGWR